MRLNEDEYGMVVGAIVASLILVWFLFYTGRWSL